MNSQLLILLLLWSFCPSICLFVFQQVWSETLGLSWKPLQKKQESSKKCLQQFELIFNNVYKFMILCVEMMMMMACPVFSLGFVPSLQDFFIRMETCNKLQ